MHMRLIAGFAALLLSFAASAQEIHSRHCLHGCPYGGDIANDLIVRDIYILMSNDLTKLADWVAYRVSRDTIGAVRPSMARADPLLRGHETLEPEDYQGAAAAIGVEPGYHAPMASFANTRRWDDTNLLSNIAPMKRAFARGPWRRLKAAVRRLAQRPSVEAVYVMTGPVFERAMVGLPGADEPHVMPSAYWKIVSIRDGGGARIAAFILGQDLPPDADYCRYRVSVREIGIKIAYSFFHDLRGGLTALTSEIGC